MYKDLNFAKQLEFSLGECFITEISSLKKLIKYLEDVLYKGRH